VSSDPREQCYRDSGAEYRGVANVTVSGSSCLPWNSDLLFSELTVDTVDSAPLRGLGEHAFCRWLLRLLTVSSCLSL